MSAAITFDTNKPFVWTGEKGQEHKAIVSLYWVLEDGTARLILKDENEDDQYHLAQIDESGDVKVIRDSVHLTGAVKVAKMALSDQPFHCAEGKITHLLAMGVMAGVGGGYNG